MEQQGVYIHESSLVSKNVKIGSGTKIWHFCHIMDDVTLGNHCSIGQNVFIASGVQLGNCVKVQNNVSLYTGVICDDFVFLGPSCVFTNVVNPRSHVVRKSEYKSTFVGKGASIGANATIVCGVKIGPYALIGAGAVIIRDVPAHALMVGNPARQIGWISQDGYKLNFDSYNKAFCKEEDRYYYLVNNSIQVDEN